jgi:uncharacterized membrane protein
VEAAGNAARKLGRDGVQLCVTFLEDCVACIGALFSVTAVEVVSL